jgi:hypothetical protein
MVGSRIARAMTYGILFARNAPQRFPNADQRGVFAAAAPSKTAGSTSIQRTKM